MKLIVSNNKGIALVTSLMLTLVILGIVMALFYVLTQSMKISAATKRYQSVTEATYGGSEFMAFDLIGNAWKNYSSAGGMSSQLVNSYGNINLAVSTSDDCLRQKLSSPTTNWTKCSAAQKSMDIASIKTSPDMTFLLKGAATGQHYKVYAKILEATAGNTDTSAGSMLTAADSGGFDDASGVAYQTPYTGGGGGAAIKQIPYTYRIDVQGEKETNPMEKSNVSVLYAY
ncbi:MAG: pilus assembly PilX N-terminal domain-containing protein [Geobacteraceae bacterium]|nr:pilus assembly PilX N-terminal domain-containing protein [Geobacteraceae bacterium]